MTGFLGQSVYSLFALTELRVTKKRHHHLWLSLGEKVLQTSPGFQITCSNNNIIVCGDKYITQICMILKAILFGGKMWKINYITVLGLITFISTLYISRMTVLL